MTCDECGGSGWIIATDDKGYSSARPCSCRAKAAPPSRPSSEACVRVAQLILENAPFAPKSDDMKTAIEAWLLASISSNVELRRFMSFALEHMGEWGGIGGLRALLESMRETAAQEIVAAETDRKFLEWKEQAKRLGEQPRPEPLQIEAACKMPEPSQVRRGALAARLNRERTEKREPVREGTLDEAEEQVRQQIESAPKRSEEERDRIIAEMNAKVRRMPA
jgi:hypothetical protein